MFQMIPNVLIMPAPARSLHDKKQKSYRRDGTSEPNALSAIIHTPVLHDDGKLLTKFYPFERINDAASDSERGITVKPNIRIGKAQSALSRLRSAQNG